MQLTEDERAALERYRNTTHHYLLVDADRQHLALTMLRLFPVRTYGNLVIRWDDEVTPEKLVACGGKRANPADTEATTCVVDMGCELWAWFRDESVIWLYKGTGAHELAIPRNMGEVWQLMERCGIEEGGGN